MVPPDSDHRWNFELFIKFKAPSPLDPFPTSRLLSGTWVPEWYACIVSTSPWLSKQAKPLHSRPALPQERPPRKGAAQQIAMSLSGHGAQAAPSRKAAGAAPLPADQPWSPNTCLFLHSSTPHHTSRLAILVCLLDSCFTKCGPGTPASGSPEQPRWRWGWGGGGTCKIQIPGPHLGRIG